VAVTAEWTPTLGEWVGLWGAWSSDATGDAASILQQGLMEGQVVELEATAPGSVAYRAASRRLAVLLNSPGSGTTSLGWAGVSGRLELTSWSEVRFTAGAAFGTVGATSASGGTAATAALEKMRQVFEKMEGSAGLVHGFGERTQKIGKIVEVITGISQQTSLLALNAAIEAAHAGEYGRGFSVVADEIRKLSEATRRSAEEITALVGEIGQESSKVLASMESGTLEIREGREVIDTVRGSLEGIISGTVEVAHGVREISTLAAEQARGSEEMVKATDEISRIAEDNAAATQQASAATEELTASLEQMAASAQELANLADGLRQTASRFRVAARA
jgi:methyl-accepting chemotaxis protein